MKDDKLVEGKWYHFKIAKQIDFEGELFFVLITPFNTKITIPAEPYKNYIIKVGEEILCKVDKISCSGKIYLEPEHPFYKTGRVYAFDIKFVREINEEYNGALKMVYFKDFFDNIIEIPAWKSFNESMKKVDMNVVRIKKSNIIAFPENETYKMDYDDGSNLKLKFIYKYENIKKEGVYVAEDQFKAWHLIPAKYFSTINIPYQFELDAIVVKHPTNDFFYIEPDHPYYKRGEIYPFTVIHCEIIHNIKNENNISQVNLRLKDDFYDNYRLTEFMQNPPKQGNIVKLKNLGLRKGVLRLEFPK